MKYLETDDILTLERILPILRKYVQAAHDEAELLPDGLEAMQEAEALIKDIDSLLD